MHVRIVESYFYGLANLRIFGKEKKNYIQQKVF